MASSGALPQDEAQLAEQCRRTGSLFTDPNFTADGNALYTDPNNRPADALPPSLVRWRRLREICTNPQLFCEGVEPGDVIQGALGDCWLLGALSVLATKGSLLPSLFVEENKRCGFYICRFFKEGAWRNVIVDDMIPCDVGGRPLYATCKDPNEVWVMILEKAYAKLHGSYEALIGGAIEYALRDLTGGAPQRFSFEDQKTLADIESGKLWRQMITYKKQGALMGCACVGAGEIEGEVAQGVLRNHAYGVLGFREVRGHKLVHVRNPWGMKEWTGRWSDGSREWTPDIMRELNHEFGDDGAFYMAFDDFVTYYNNLYVCRIFPDDWCRVRVMDEWRGETAGGCINFKTWSRNPQFHLNVTRENEVFIVLTQTPDARMVPGANWNQYDKSIGFLVLKNPRNEQRIFKATRSNLAGRTDSFRPTRAVSLELTLAPGSYVISPSTFEPGKEGRFIMSVYAQNKISLRGGELLPDPIDIDDLDEDERPPTPQEEMMREPEEEQLQSRGAVDTLQDIIKNLLSQVKSLRGDVNFLKDRVHAMEAAFNEG